MVYDFFIIGGGSGGVRAARYASSQGYKVALAEAYDLGGTCVNRGCIPKKLYSYASSFHDEINIMKSFGYTVSTPKFSWMKLVKAKKKELKRLNNIYEKLLSESNVKLFKGYASIFDKDKVSVGNKILSAKKIIIAVGTTPKKIQFECSKSIITSDDVFDLQVLPKNILILGGGYIAIELASIFNGLGVNTSISLRGNSILNGFDKEVTLFLENQMKLKGVKIINKNFPEKITRNKDYFNVIYKNNCKNKYDLVLEAVGRVPNLEKLNLHKIGIKQNDRGFIKVDKMFRTNVKNIFAVGDIIDKVQLTPVAIAEAVWLIDNHNKKNFKNFDYKNIPTAVFSNPNFASIGLSENDAKKKKISYKVFRSEFRPLKHSLSKSKEKVFIKIIINSINQKILGIHYVGENAAEIIQGFSVAVVNGLTKHQLDKTIGIHPTSAEELVTMK